MPIPLVNPTFGINLTSNEAAPAVADLCCGMGGLSLAARQLGMRVVFGVDPNTCALRTYHHNFPEARVVEGSVRSRKALDTCLQLLKPLNGASGPSVVVSGPPCQGFSAAGSRNPADPRNQILIAVARAVVHLQPNCALLENVSTVLAGKHGSRLSAFRNTLAEGGYFVHEVLVDAVDFGVAQRRRRAFFLISREEFDRQEVERRLDQKRQPQVTVQRALGNLPSPRVRPEDYDDSQDYGAIPNHLAMRHSDRVAKKIAALEPGTGPMSYRRLHPARPANTLFSGHRAPPAHFLESRSITVREAARLQGFPDDFRIYGSFANQMAQVTNAVPPPLARAVLQVLTDMIALSPRGKP